MPLKELSKEVDRQKSRALEAVVSEIQKRYGLGSVMRLGSDDIVPIETIPTGALSLDLCLGIGGVPRGRIVEIFGPESGGKTTLSLHVIANAQARGGAAAFIDAEHAIDPSYARRLGVQTDQLLLSQPDSGEQALEIAEALVNSNAVDVIVIDSVAALVPRQELEGEMGDASVGLQARLMSQALRKLTASISRSKTCVIFINQIREKIGGYGNPETTSGGRALKFYSSVRIEVRRVTSIKTGEDTVGNRVKATVVKNKCAPPFRKTEFDIMFGRGIVHSRDLVDTATELKVVDKSGAWFTFGDTRLGQGRENAAAFLDANPDVMARVEDATRKIAVPVAETEPLKETA
ncbi:MAG: recombinase RecA [Candidatus Brocadiae bacterium]|nr:recombinase RecA [Candidatus Brocadiia bacterium]